MSRKTDKSISIHPSPANPGPEEISILRPLDSITHQYQSLSKVELLHVLGTMAQEKQAIVSENQLLQTARENYELIYNQSGIGYLTLNEDGKIQNINLAAENLFGYSKSVLVKKNLEYFIHPEDQQHYQLFIQAASTTSPQNKTITLRFQQPNLEKKTKNNRRKNDRPQDIDPMLMLENYRYIEFQHAFNKKQANNVLIHLTINDITEHKYAQQRISYLNEHLNRKILEQSGELIASSQKLLKKVAELNQSKRLLQEREARLNSIFNAAIEGIITIDSHGNIVAINSAVTNIFGYQHSELIGKSVIKLLPRSKTKHYAHYLKKYLSVHIPKIIGHVSEIEGAHKNETLIPIDLSVSVFDHEGKTYFTGIVRDITQRKMQDRQDKALLDELAHVTRLGLMGEMASGIAHEVNQPLSAIASYTQTCLNFMQNDSVNLAQVREILLKTQQQALNAGQIIHRMRDFVKFKTIHRATVDINHLVQICIDLCVADLKHNAIIQRLELANNLPSISVDSVQIEQVLINLIRNAVDALKSLPLATRRYLSIQTRLSNENTIEIRVKDNGPGIADIDQSKILTPFFTTKTDGMGMGLSISHSIIKAHEGTLHFNSKVDKGTTFYFNLPIRKK